MNIKKIASENYKKFCFYEGSDYIASEFALETLLKLITVFNIKSVLEVGLGIGSVADTILHLEQKQSSGIDYYGTETNEFCLNALRKNVTHYEKIKLFPDIKEVPERKFELFIIDGSDDSLKVIKKYTNRSSIFFVEGDRKEQTQTILRLFPNHLYVNVITLRKNPPYAHEGRAVNSYIGGGQLIFVNPTLKMIFYWLKEKAGTFIKIKIRKWSK
ncbi:hypothetical protein [Flavobacterium johnsoniae]|uniref:Uncharacterized protein n=1 Tax=Flavobacterium johnsoniae TaxID=986 RepID=A0A1M5L1S1_FLAJO|nr:hypothetical protein [Flavobacterium johnsoniae]SHG58941.1 hypothetical protein SAMN05444388_103297 [Flavobacterium johnsoniae]